LIRADFPTPDYEHRTFDSQTYNLMASVEMVVNIPYPHIGYESWKYD
jgi:hypothetical protein